MVKLVKQVYTLQEVWLDFNNNINFWHIVRSDSEVHHRQRIYDMT